jgi:hypothetical protein
MEAGVKLFSQSPDTTNGGWARAIMIFGFVIAGVCILGALIKLAEAHSGVNRIFRELEIERQLEIGGNAGLGISS